jgi:DNA-binding transcriptional regulator WhiA
MITEKYCAGLVDSDGHIGHNVKKNLNGTFTVDARVTIKQRKDRSEVLFEIAKQWSISVFNDADTHCIVFTGNKARRLLEQIKNHLVIKPDVAELILRTTPTVCSEENLKLAKTTLKQLRTTGTTKVKNYPSRQWMAGYFDGDGSITADAKGRLRIQFSSHINEQAGIRLIQKAFGGSIHTEGNGAKLYINVPYRYSVNKIEKILGHFGKHCIIKQSQVQFVLGHAGKISTEELYDKLKQLKQPASTK